MRDLRSSIGPAVAIMIAAGCSGSNAGGKGGATIDAQPDIGTPDLVWAPDGGAGDAAGGRDTDSTAELDPGGTADTAEAVPEIDASTSDPEMPDGAGGELSDGSIPTGEVNGNDGGGFEIPVGEAAGTDGGGDEIPVGDAANTDGAIAGDEASGDAEVDVAPPANCPVGIEIIAPESGTYYPVGAAISLAALVTGIGDDPEGLQVSWRNVVGEEIGTSEVAADGTAVLETFVASAGMHLVHAIVVTPDGPCPIEATLALSICQQHIVEDFDDALDEAFWTVFGDAYWDLGGWLEMTGLWQDGHGAIYNDQTLVTAGSASIRFRIATGGGTGADGFAMTIIDAGSPQALATLVASAHSGGGLGYGISGDYGDWKGSALTVEIDTWHNIQNPGMTEKHTDPTPENHVAITLDGDPGNHLVWATVPNIEDLAWRPVQVDVNGKDIRVWLDGKKLIDAFVPQLDFRGGYIFFSGSTGFYTNYHRFDDLEILHGCN